MTRLITVYVPPDVTHTPVAVQIAWLAWETNRRAKCSIDHKERSSWYSAKAAYVAALCVLHDQAIIQRGIGTDCDERAVVFFDLYGIGQVSYHVFPERDCMLAASMSQLAPYPFPWVGRGWTWWPLYQPLTVSAVATVPQHYHAERLNYATAHTDLVRAGLSPAALTARTTL